LASATGVTSEGEPLVTQLEYVEIPQHDEPVRPEAVTTAPRSVAWLVTRLYHTLTPTAEPGEFCKTDHDPTPELSETVGCALSSPLQTVRIMMSLLTTSMGIEAVVEVVAVDVEPIAGVEERCAIVAYTALGSVEDVRKSVPPESGSSSRV
jgi:hypothetical protein